MNRTLISILLAGLFGLYCGYANAGSYTDGTGAAAGTVTDNVTNLRWQKCSAGLSGATCATGTAATYQWDGPTTSAISYCETLSFGGFTDWRLPNTKELSSLVDDTRVNPSIDPLFPNTQTSSPFYYWSSTTYAGSTASAWHVNFGGGYVLSYVKTNTGYVRCVRGQ